VLSIPKCKSKSEESGSGRIQILLGFTLKFGPKSRPASTNKRSIGEAAPQTPTTGKLDWQSTWQDPMLLLVSAISMAANSPSIGN